MPAPFEEMSSLDRLVHEPARLAILTALAGCDAADFVFLQSLTGLTKGNLSGHLHTLERAGLVTIDKRFRGKVPQTHVQLTSEGRASIEKHWEQLQALGKAARQWKSTWRLTMLANPRST